MVSEGVLLLTIMLPCLASAALVYGVDKNNKVFTIDIDGDHDAGKQWKPIKEGKLSDISASGRIWVWGVNPGGTVFRCKKPCTGAWQAVDEDVKMKRISGGLREIYAVDSSQNIWARNANDTGGWRKIPGRLVYISADNQKWVWGANYKGAVFYCAKPCRGN